MLKLLFSVTIVCIGFSISAFPAEATRVIFSPLPDYHKLVIQRVQNEVSINELLYGPAKFFLSTENPLPKENFEKPQSPPSPTPTPQEISLLPQKNKTGAESTNPQVTALVPGSGASDEVFDNLAACESHQNWQDNTENGYYGGLQFSQGTWESVGGIGLPSAASREEQIKRARILQTRSGWRQWPACSRFLGLNAAS